MYKNTLYAKLEGILRKGHASKIEDLKQIVNGQQLDNLTNLTCICGALIQSKPFYCESFCVMCSKCYFNVENKCTNKDCEK